MLDTIRLSANLTELITVKLGEPKYKKWHCPFHDDKTPSLSVFKGDDNADRWKCFGCGKFGDAIDWIMEIDNLGFKEAMDYLSGNKIILSSEANEKAQENGIQAKIEQQSNQLALINQLNQNNNVARYHHQLDDFNSFWWHNKGVNDTTIKHYKLGYTSSCPTAKSHESYTIPVVFRGTLYNIRHRLADREKDKYRPEMSGLPLAMFNADILDDDTRHEIVLVEGEIKAMVLRQYGFDAVGIPGAHSFKKKWIRLFNDKLVYIALDPGAEETAEQIWQQFRKAETSCRLCHFPVKPDDFFTEYDGAAHEFYQYLRLGVA